MKKILLTLGLLALPALGHTAIKQVDEFITPIPLNCFDSAGVDALPDSVHVHTYLDGGSAAAFNTRSVTYPFSDISIDTLKIYGDTTYWYVDQIQDIDGSPTPTAYTISIDVVMWTETPGIATHNRSSEQVVRDSFHLMLDSVGLAAVSSQANRDTLEGLAMDNLKEAFDDDAVGPTMFLRAFNVTAAGADSNAVNFTGFGSGEGLLSTGGATGSGIGGVSGGSNGFGIFAIGTGAGEGMRLEGGATGFGLNILGFGSPEDLGGTFTNNNFATDAFTSDGLSASFITELFDSLFTTRVDADTATNSYFGSLLNDLTAIRDSIQFLITSSGDTAIGGDERDVVIGLVQDTVNAIIDSVQAQSKDNLVFRGAVAGAPTAGDDTTVAIDGDIDVTKADDYYNNMTIMFTTGAHIGKTATFFDWDGTLDSMHFKPALGTVLADNDSFVVMPQWVYNSVWRAQFPTETPVAGSFVDTSSGWGATSAGGLDSQIVSNIVHRVANGTPRGSGSDSSTLAERDGTVAAVEAGAYDSTAWSDSTFTSPDFATNWYNEFATKFEVATTVADTTYKSVTSGNSRNTIASSWGAQVDQLARSSVVELATITGATPTATGFSSTALTQADDFWNNNMIMMLSGATAGQAARISDFTASTDSVTFEPVLSASPAQNDTFVIFGFIHEAGGAVTITDADMQAIRDTILGTNINDVTFLGADTSYGEFVLDTNHYQGSAAGLDSQIVSNIMHRVGWGTPRGSGSDSSTLAERDATVAAMDNDVVTAASIAAGAITTSEAPSFTLIIDTVNAIIDTIQDGVNGIDVNVIALEDNTSSVTSIKRAFTAATNGTAQAGAAGSITLAAGESALDDFYKGCMIAISTGAGNGQYRLIDAYDGTTKIATVNMDWITNPSATSQYVLWGNHDVFAIDGDSIVIDGSALLTLLANNRDVVTGYTGTFFGTVNDAAPTTSAFVAAAAGSVSPFDLSRSDDFYNNGTLIFVSGNLKGRSQPITDWKTTQDSLINRGFFAAPTNGDTFMVVSQGFPDVFAISNSTLAADNLEEAFDDDAVGPTMRLRAFNVIAVGTDSNAVNLTGDGTANGIQITGGITGIGADLSGGASSGSGLRLTGTGISTDMTGEFLGANFGLDAISANALAASAVTEIMDSLFDTRVPADTTTGSWVGRVLTSGSAITDAQMGAIADSVHDKDTLDAFAIAGGFGKFVKDSAAATGGAASITDADMAAIADSVWFAGLEAHDGVAGSFGDSAQTWGATSDLSGSGAVTVVIAATDTSGADTTVSGVPLTLRDLAGNQIGLNQITNTDGYTTWSLTAGDSMTIQIAGTVHNSHIWQSDADTFVVPATLDTFGVGSPTSADSLLMGFDVPVSTPSAANTCVITFHLGDIDGIVDNEDLFGRKVTFTLPGQHIDSCANPVSVMTNVSKDTVSNIDGIVTMQLRYSNCVEDTQYALTINHPSFTDRVFNITVPRQATYTLKASDFQ